VQVLLKMSRSFVNGEESPYVIARIAPRRRAAAARGCATIAIDDSGQIVRRK
jgi:hypothetical protein